MHHLHTPEWLHTTSGAPRGYIQPHALEELWFHTGTACNLSCPFCLEGSRPGDHRLEQIHLEDVRPLMEEAMPLGVQQFSFTGGEPFINKDFLKILDFALERQPCLVLTNGTRPLHKRLHELAPLLAKPHAVRFRVSLDHPDPAAHDAARGEGAFALALKSLQELHNMGFGISIARQMNKDEDTPAIIAAYQTCFQHIGIPEDTRIVAFPDFLGPGAHPGGVPEITGNCMTTYHTEASRKAFMCGYSKMIVKIGGRMRVYACTLVDDDPGYDLGATLAEALPLRVMLRHHRCFSCFASGASCSER
ncbi:MAG: radical SAM protein [Candidatus Hydrogenedentes bacterium]|nr:radical SAM protein [Candidatus Hydrogenedentota bacterium]